MKTRDLVELASRNLREAALRNTLTTAGIAVGVASLVAMLSLGIGLQTLTINRLEGTGLFNTIYVYPKTNRGGRGGRGGEAPDEARPGDIKMLTDQIARAARGDAARGGGFSRTALHRGSALRRARGM